MNKKSRLYIKTVAVLALLTFTLALVAVAQPSPGTPSVTANAPNPGTPVAIAPAAAETAALPSLGGAFDELGQAIANSTNWTVAAGYGFAVEGKDRQLGFLDVAYNLTEHVGLIVGMDYLWGGEDGDSQWNDIRGGLTLSARIRPFAFLGSTFLTNVVARPFVADLIATPRDDDSIGNIVVTGAHWDIYSIKNWELGALTAYENRSGQGDWDGNYGLIGLTFSRKF